MEVSDKYHSIKRTSIIAFLSVAVLFSACFFLVAYNLRLQQNMLQASSVSYELRILLDRSNKQANLLFDPQNVSQLSDRILLKIRDDFIKTTDQVSDNNKLLRDLLVKRNSSFGLFVPSMNNEKMSIEMNMIDSIWNDFQPRIKEIASYRTDTLRVTNKHWKPVDVSISHNSALFKSISELNHLVYSSSLYQNQWLSLLYAIIAILVLSGIWAIWSFTLRPLGLRLKSSYQEILRKNQNLDYQANHDALTGLLNRAAFNKKIKAIESEDRNDLLCCLILVDLDEFKAINDTLGHDAGDQVLKKIADNLLQSPMKGETAYRLGGDEFALFIDKAEDSGILASRLDGLVSGIRNPLELDDRTIHCSCSLGVAITGKRCGTDLDELFKAADTALYDVKENGRDGYRLFHEIAHSSVLDKAVQDECLQQALVNGEFHVYYQPILDIQNGNLLGFEASIRWHHQQKGSLSSEHWYADVERLGLDSVIMKHVLETISQHFRAWKKQQLRLYPVSINISEKMLMNGEGLNIFCEVRKTLPVSSKLGVEFNETILSQRSFNLIKEQLLQFEAEGISITLDHFGTGQASLSQLAEIPYDILKIDQNITARTSSDSTAKAMISSLVRFSEVGNKVMICQGVEDEITRNELSKLGCLYSESVSDSELLSYANALKMISSASNKQNAQRYLELINV